MRILLTTTLLLFLSESTLARKCGDGSIFSNPSCVSIYRAVNHRADLAWTQIPNSNQDTIFVPGVDDSVTYSSADSGEVYYGSGVSDNSWKDIQGAWSGAVCANEKLYVHGGGHGDGWHNGILSVDPQTGVWERVTEPSPIYPKDDPRCPDENCWTGPDGNPVARHSYNLLASDGEYLYASSGSKWRSGKGGGDDANWKYHFGSGEWSAFPISGLEKAHGNLVHVNGRLYQTFSSGYAIYDIADETWTYPRGERKISGISGSAMMVYEPQSDVFVVIGNGVAWRIPRDQFGKVQPIEIANAPTAVETKYPGVTVRDGKVLLWPNAGSTITTYDPANGEWGQLTPAGQPVDGFRQGTFGRFNYCSGELVLVNGHNVDLYQVKAGVPGEPAPEPQPVPQPEPSQEPAPEPDTDPEPSPLPGDWVGEMKRPYYAQPPVNIAEEVCGPYSEWQTFDIRTDADTETLRNFKHGDRVIVNVHWRDTPYPVLKNKVASCLKYVGIPGPQGQKPVVAIINASTRPKDTIRIGGIMIVNLRLSMSDYQKVHGDYPGGSDCIGIPNDKQFVIMRNLDVSGCGHHAFITSRAYNMYLEIGNSHFEYAKSHLAYIDQVAMAYIYDSTFSSPGWGHALRCIAARCVFKNVNVSNVDLDGTVAPMGVNALHPERTYIGMHPLDLYLCGSEHQAKNVKVVFKRRKGFVYHATALRQRGEMNTCNLGSHDDKEWQYAPYGSNAWYAGAYKTPITWNFDGLHVQCVDTPCYGMHIKSSYPLMDGEEVKPIIAWNAENNFSNWEEVMAKVPEQWKWTLQRIFPEYRQTFLNKDYRGNWPLEVPLDWAERATITLKNFTVENARNGQKIRPRAESRFCYGHLEQCGPNDPQANITHVIDP